MTQRIISSSAIPTRVFNNHPSRRVFFLSSSAFFISCLLFLLFGMAMPDKGPGSTENAAATSAIVTSTILPTKWWINTPATSLPTRPAEVISNSAKDCPASLSSQLQPGIYAYISQTPSLPNRIRAGAAKASPYLGQVYPGESVKIIDGPLCADEFSWWLVESVERGLRGWTVAGSNSKQWVLPCPNPAVACKKTQVVPHVTLTTTSSSTQDSNYAKCHSDTFSIGMLTQVKPENLLVIRSEPYLSSVLGHAGPMSAVIIVGGPACAGGVLWWKVNVASLNLSGWAAEANLRACSKEDGCT